MTNDELMNIAMDWVETMKTSTDTELLRPELDAWLTEDPRHRIAYQSAERHWAGIRKAVILLKQNGPLPHDALHRELDEAARRSQRRRQVKKQARICAIAIAASSACAALVGIRLMSTHAPSANWVDYAGGSGTPQKHILDDGSDLFLNYNSAARFRMTAAVREVALDRGELLVHVEHDAKRSFLVRAGNAVLRATGTEFSVRRESTGDLATTVRDGKIEISPAGVSPPAKSTEQPTLVAAGQTATISGGKVQVETQDPVEIENRLAWARGRLYLHGTLAQAVSQFNEQNETQLAIADVSISNMSITGLYNSHDIREFAESLRSRGVRYQVKKVVGSAHDIIILTAEKQHSR